MRLKTKDVKKQTRTNFGGYSVDSDFMKMEHNQFVDMCKGELIVSIGNGSFSNTVWNVVGMSIARGAKQEYEQQQEKELAS